MRNILMVAGLSVAVATMAAAMTQQKAEQKTQPSKAAAQSKTSAAEQSREQDEKAIRQVIDAVTKAYNAKDAKVLAALFTTEGEIVDEDGNMFQGHQAIEQVFATAFEEKPTSKLEISVESIHFVSPSVAIEEGTTKVTHSPNEPAEYNRYIVVYAKQDGKWQMASARDLPDEAESADEQLKQLEWLIGDWIDESPDSLVKTSYKWTDNHRFILSEFTVQIGGRSAMTGTTRIGWDPLAKQIRSWIFDSEGGFGEGLWSREANQWVVKLSGVTRDGRVGSATNTLTVVSKDRVIYQSHDRMAGGELTPDIEEIPIVRAPPKPGDSK